jgi:hypothetical protein
MKKNKILILLILIICLFINKQNAFAEITEETLSVSNVTLNKTDLIPGETLNYSFNVNAEFSSSRFEIHSTVYIKYADGTIYTIESALYDASTTLITGTYNIPSKVGDATFEIQVSKYGFGKILLIPSTVIVTRDITINENISVTNVSLNKINFIPGETLSYSFNVDADFSSSRYEIYAHVYITYADGSYELIEGNSYDASTNVITGTLVLPSEIGIAEVGIQVSKYADDQIFPFPATVLVTRNITINENLSVSNVTLNKTTISPGETLNYSYKVSGNLVDGAGIWCNVKITYADGTSTQVENQFNSSYNTTISGSLTMPAKYGNATLQVIVNKYYNSTIQSSPSASASRSFNIVTAGTADFSNVSYVIPFVGTNIWTLYWAEEYNIEFDITNTGETDVDVICYSIYTPPGIDEEEMVIEGYINPTYFTNDYKMDVNERGIIEPNQSHSTVLFTDFNTLCSNYGYYNLWIFSCNKEDNRVFDKKKKEIFFDTSPRPKNIKPIITPLTYYSYENESLDKRMSGDMLALNENIVFEIGKLNHDEISISCYPNPVYDNLFFEFNLEPNSKGEITIYDLTGRKVKQESITSSENNSQMSISDLNPGIYLWTIEVNGVPVKSEKLIKK